MKKYVVGDEVELNEVPDENNQNGMISQIFDDHLIVLVYNFESEESDQVIFYKGMTESTDGNFKLYNPFE
jgi:hypothetical protein